MDKRAMLDRIADNGEERLLLSRVWDQYDRCAKKNIPAATSFLSPQEQQAARRLLQAIGAADGFLFWGGYEGAERCQLHFLPDWSEEPDREMIRAIHCTWYRSDTLTHRDFLGSLMGLGLTREKIGDILVGKECADVLVSAQVADFLLGSWDAAGRVKLHLSEIALDEIVPPEVRTKEIRDTVSSLRLDSIASAGFSISRGKAAEAIQGGRVQLNWTNCTKPDRMVSQGDVISLRGLGKCILETVGHETKKGRVFVTIRRYL